MILPTKSIKPIDSLYCISSYVFDILSLDGSLDSDVLLHKINNIYPEEVSAEKLQYCLDFLFIIGKLELENETVKAIFK